MKRPISILTAAMIALGGVSMSFSPAAAAPAAPAAGALNTVLPGNGLTQVHDWDRREVRKWRKWKRHARRARRHHDHFAYGYYPHYYHYPRYYRRGPGVSFQFRFD